MNKIYNISIFIITYNEENDIANCIESVKWSNDIVVLDSFSTDNTVNIVESYTDSRVFQRAFDDYASQRNYGLKNIDFMNEWVLIIDADEICTSSLREEIFSLDTCIEENIVAYSIRRKTFLCDKWMKHNTMYNVWIERLIKPKSVLFYGKVHEKLKHEGVSKALDHTLDHYPFSKGIDFWISRRNRFSTLSAEYELANSYDIVIQDLFSKNPIKVRALFNAIYRRTPLRWLIFFFYNIFIKLTFLDGLKGMHYILLETYYEFQIICKINYKKNKC